MLLAIYQWTSYQAIFWCELSTEVSFYFFVLDSLVLHDYGRFLEFSDGIALDVRFQMILYDLLRIMFILVLVSNCCATPVAS